MGDANVYNFTSFLINVVLVSSKHCKVDTWFVQTLTCCFCILGGCLRNTCKVSVGN